MFYPLHCSGKFRAGCWFATGSLHSCGLSRWPGNDSDPANIGLTLIKSVELCVKYFPWRILGEGVRVAVVGQAETGVGCG